MIFKFLYVFLIFGHLSSQTANHEKEKKNGNFIIMLYYDGVPKDISKTAASGRIVSESVKLFSTADDIYLKPITQKSINEFKQKGCVEIIFKESREFVVKAVDQKHKVSKILIPINDDLCGRYAHVIYGNPNYDDFNLLLNSKGCKELLKLLPGRTHIK